MSNFCTALQKNNKQLFSKDNLHMTLELFSETAESVSGGMRKKGQTWLFTLRQGPKSRIWLALIFRTRLPEK